MLAPQEIKLLAAILSLLVLGWMVKTYREHAHVEAVPVSAAKGKGR